MTRTFVENVDMRNLHYLNAQLTPEMVSVYADPDEFHYYTNVKRALQSFVKHHGSVQRKYKPSVFDKLDMFRLYSDGIQRLPAIFSAFIMPNHTDIDMVASHPSIVLNLCQKHSIECPYLHQYCTQRSQLIAEGKITKTQFATLMNKGSPSKGLSSFGQRCDTEMKIIQKELVQHYPDIFEIAKENNKRNPYGSFMAYLGQHFERKIIDAIVAECPYKISVLMFDGFLVEGDVPETYIASLTPFIQDKLGMTVHFINKPRVQVLSIPEDYQYDNPDIQYATLKKKYEEQGLAYIESTSTYSLKIAGKMMFKTRDELFRHFEREKVGNEHFFLRWREDSTAQVFQDVGMYAHDVKCPDNVLNLWTEFAISKVVAEPVDIEPFLRHVKIMANHDEKVYEFLLQWFANLFQFPSTPSVFVALTSDEGTGKSALVQLITNMIGKDKSIEIDDPATQLFGNFNEHLKDSVFLNINEVDRKDMNQFYNRLKSAINSPTCEVHGKGQKAFHIRNTRHYFCTTNNAHAVIIKDGNRRYMLAETSSELIGNHEYFEKFFELIENPAFQASVYKFLMEYKCPRQFTVKDIPITPLMKDAYELNRDPIEDFMTSFTSGCDADELYIEYKDFMRRHGYEQGITSKAFLMKFAKYKDKYRVEIKRDDKIVDGERSQRRVYVRKCLLA